MYAIKTTYKGNHYLATCLETPPEGKRRRQVRTPNYGRTTDAAEHRAALAAMLAKLDSDMRQYWKETGRAFLADSVKQMYQPENWISAYAGNGEMVHICTVNAYTIEDTDPNRPQA